jgi:SAM-dependent methyltransferase
LRPDSHGDTEARCRDCGATYLRIDGIWRMLTPSERQQYGSFLEGYPLLRQREGWERDQAYFLALPNVPPDDPASFVWSIRNRSLAVLDTLLAGQPATDNWQPTTDNRQPEATAAWALDLGAGNGWLSRHLTHLGYRTVALDLTIGGLDSLAGAQLYIEHDEIWLGRVQASMSNPPFAGETFSLCVISAALHYAGVQETLDAASNLLVSGGLLVITDSPVYAGAEAGRAMAAERREQIASLLGAQPPELPGGNNYLVESEMPALMDRASFTFQVIPIERPLGRLKRSLYRTVRPGAREQARFPVMVGRKM